MFAVAIHFTLVFLISPVTSRMGTDQSWKEVVFMSYSDLREAAVLHAITTFWRYENYFILPGIMLLF